MFTTVHVCTATQKGARFMENHEITYKQYNNQNSVPRKTFLQTKKFLKYIKEGQTRNLVNFSNFEKLNLELSTPRACFRS